MKRLILILILVFSLFVSSYSTLYNQTTGAPLLTTSANTNKLGQEFITNYNNGNNITLTKAFLGASATPTTAYLLLNSTGATLSTQTFIGGIATFNYPLAPNTAYRIMSDSGGASYTRAYTNPFTYPVTNSYLNWTAAWFAATRNTANAYNVYQIEIDFTPSTPTPQIQVNITNGAYYDHTPIIVSLNTSSNVNMSYSLNGASFTSVETNIQTAITSISFIEGNNNISFRSIDNNGVNHNNISINIDTINPIITNNIPSEIFNYNFNGSWFSCSDSNLDYCNVSLGFFDVLNFPTKDISGTDYNLTALSTSVSFNQLCRESFGSESYYKEVSYSATLTALNWATYDGSVWSSDSVGSPFPIVETLSCFNPFVNKASGTDFNIVYNGNVSYLILSSDSVGNEATETGFIFIVPQFKVYFYNNTEYLTNFGINGTNYTNYFNGSIYDYGLGNHSFLFQKTGYNEINFYLDFTNTSDINQTIFTSPAFVKFEIKDLSDYTNAPIGNYTLIISEVGSAISEVYAITNSNNLTISNNYVNSINLSISVIYNSSITTTIEIITARQNVTIPLYLTFDTTEIRTIEVLEATLIAIPNSEVYLYTYVTGQGFILETIKRTNVLGQVSFNIVPLTRVYNICNTHDNELVCLDQITFENALTDPYQIIHGTTFTPIEVDYLNYITWSYSEIKTNITSQMTFTFNDAQSLVDRFCYNVTRYTNNVGAYIGKYCNNNPSGQVVQTFGLTQNQYIDYNFYYRLNGLDNKIFTYRSYYFNQNLDTLKATSLLDAIFLIIYFGAIGLLLRFNNFDYYNIGILTLLAVIVSVQSVLNENYVTGGIWVFTALKTMTLYFVKVES